MVEYLVMDDRIEAPLTDQTTDLSERELEIVRLLATGLSNKEIAGQLYLSVNTVKVHLRNIFAKLNVQSRTEATVIAIQRGWVNVPGPAATNGTSAEVTATPIGPAIEIEPPLPIGRRITLIGVTLIAIVLAVIAGPRGSAQSNPPAQPFSDSPTGNPLINTATGDTTWQAQLQMSLARGRLAAASIGSQVIAIGGEAASGVSSMVEILDTSTQRWHTGQSKPIAVANVSAAVIGNTIVIPGGYTSAGVPTPIVEAYDPFSDKWGQLASLPAPRFAYAIATYKDKVYMFGGWDGRAYVNTTLVYDPKTDRWSTRASLPLGRGFSGAATLGNAIYVVGGYVDGRELNRCDRYLPDNDRWEECAPMTVARGGLGLVSVGGRLYAIGGGWTGYLTFNERYDPASNAWSVVPTPFTGQWRGLGVTAVGNDIYALGGWNGQYLGVVEKYNPFPFNIFVPAATR